MRRPDGPCPLCMISWKIYFQLDLYHQLTARLQQDTSLLGEGPQRQPETIYLPLSPLTLRNTHLHTEGPGLEAALWSQVSTLPSPFNHLPALEIQTN